MTAHPHRLIAALLVFAVACSDSSGPGSPNENTDGRLRVVPGIAALPLVDVIVDGQVKASNVAFGTPSSAIALSLGAHQVKVVAAGTAPSAGGTTVNLKANDTTIVVAIGAANAPSTVALGDTGAIPGPGQGKLRVSHMATNAPPIDVYRLQPDFPQFITIQDPFLYQATSPFLASTPGDWVIRVTNDGTTNVLAERTIPVQLGWVRTVILLDAPNGGVRIVALGEE